MGKLQANMIVSGLLYVQYTVAATCIVAVQLIDYDHVIIL